LINEVQLKIYKERGFQFYNLNLNKVPGIMSVEENIFLARVAEQAERFEDMVNFLKPVLD
jgi:hypothetical protein